MTNKTILLSIFFVFLASSSAFAASLDYKEIQSISVLYAAKFELEPQNIPADSWLNEFDLTNLSGTFAAIKVHYKPKNSGLYEVEPVFISFEEYLDAVKSKQWLEQADPTTFFTEEEMIQVYNYFVYSAKSRITQRVKPVNEGFKQKMFYLKLFDGKNEKKFADAEARAYYYENDNIDFYNPPKSSTFNLKRIWVSLRPTRFSDSEEGETFFDKGINFSVSFTKEGFLEREKSAFFPFELWKNHYEGFLNMQLFDLKYVPESFPTLKLKSAFLDPRTFSMNFIEPEKGENPMLKSNIGVKVEDFFDKTSKYLQSIRYVEPPCTNYFSELFTVIKTRKLSDGSDFLETAHC